MREQLEKYDKLITACLVIIAFTLGVGWWVAEEKSEPVYTTKIDKLLYENRDRLSPHSVLTLPDKLVFKKAETSQDIVVDAKNNILEEKKVKDKK